MKFIPFPPEIAERSAENARAQYEARKGKRPGDHSTTRVACYRMEDGTLRMAHDLYDPQYPEGSTPGLGTVHAKLNHYPNDTSGYTLTVSDFVPAGDLIADSAPWANPCVAVTGSPGHRRFHVAPTESALADSIPGRPEDAKRPTVIMAGGDVEEAPEAIVFMNPAHRDTAVVGSAMEIATYLVSHYDVEMPDEEQVMLYHSTIEATGVTLDEACMHHVVRDLVHRYMFEVEAAFPGDMEVSVPFGFGTKEDEVDMPGC